MGFNSGFKGLKNPVANSTIRPIYGALGSQVRIQNGLQSCVEDILNSIFVCTYYLVRTEES